MSANAFYSLLRNGIFRSNYLFARKALSEIQCPSAGSHGDFRRGAAQSAFPSPLSQDCRVPIGQYRAAVVAGLFGALLKLARHRHNLAVGMPLSIGAAR